MESNTFRVPEDNIAELEKRIAKLNKAADKLGLEPVSIIRRGVETEERDGLFYDWQIIEIQGQEPKLNGWKFVATLEHDEDGTIIRKMPSFGDEIDLRDYRNASPADCDQCGYKRRRNDTYVVLYTGENTSRTPLPLPAIGTTKQVGSNCLKDFIGHGNPQAIARWMEQLRDLFEAAEGGYRDGDRIVPRYSTHEVLAHAALIIRHGGWVSKTRAYDTGERSTADNVTNNFFQKIEEYREEPEAEDYEKAEKAIAWAEALTEKDLENEYLYNLHTVLKGGSLAARQFGIAVSGIPSYDRAEQRRVERANNVSEHVGEIKKRQNFSLTLTRTIWRDGWEGEPAPLYVFQDAKGNAVKWFASRAQDFQEGQTYDLVATVKAHEDHERFGKSTIITRAMRA